MTGRGVDQILAHPGDPRLWEADVRDARTYVRLAERVSGPVPRPVADGWPWGEALPVLDDAAPDVRVVNLETSVTRSSDTDLSKGVHYRMSPENLPCLAAAGLHACALANNHVRDFGQAGLRDTLRVLSAAGIATAGAGADLREARRPAILPAGAGRVLVFSFATGSSGVPPHWAAAPAQPGVDLLPDLSAVTARQVAERVAAVKRPDDVAIASVHWGSNWGYEVPVAQVSFAHRLIDGGVDLVHGHSSHHPRPIEVYRDRLILYGCGDLIDDYEGITGYERFRDDLRLLYLASLEPATGRLAALRMAPLQARQLRLHRARGADAAWLCRMLDRISHRFGATVAGAPDGMLELRPA